MKYDFTSATIKFCAIGFFIPGFTAIVFFGFQLIFEKSGVRCDTFWHYLWALTTITALISPCIFIRNIKKTNNPTLFKLNLFNITEYMSLQICLARFFTNESIICYESGGQNGLELAFTAWIALPILVCLSYVFEKKLKIEKVN
ncbi:MAG: hypothetical protein ABI441_04315 [Flavobacterium sp.]